MKWILIVLLAASTSPITMKVSPTQSFEPATVKVTLHVDRAPENRMVFWACMSNMGYETSSRIQLNGENEIATREILLKDLPGGMYVCSARLDRQGKASANTDTIQFNVLGRGGDQ
jgi:hypothetical protein